MYPSCLSLHSAQGGVAELAAGGHGGGALGVAAKAESPGIHQGKLKRRDRFLVRRFVWRIITRIIRDEIYAGVQAAEIFCELPCVIEGVVEPANHDVFDEDVATGADRVRGDRLAEHGHRLDAIDRHDP